MFEYVFGQKYESNKLESFIQQQLMKMNIDLGVGKDELEKKKKFYEDQKNMNSKLESEINALDQAISDLSIKLTREDQNRIQFQDEVIKFSSLLIFIQDFF